MSKQLNWNFIKRCLKSRRENKKLTALGYEKHETDWEIIRGAKLDHVITDAKISCCGKYVWTKIEKKP